MSVEVATQPSMSLTSVTARAADLPDVPLLPRVDATKDWAPVSGKEEEEVTDVTSTPTTDDSLDVPYEFDTSHDRQASDFILQTGVDNTAEAFREWLDDPDDTPRFAVSTVEFTRQPRRRDLSADTLRLLETPNAGGGSIWSEAMSLQPVGLLAAVELEKCETEIQYKQRDSSITDFSVRMFDRTVGVSVTRAFDWRGGDLKEHAARRLLTKKLRNVIKSTDGVADCDRWDKQILHVWCRSHRDARLLSKIYNSLGDDVKADTFVLVTISSNADDFMYANYPPPLEP